MLFTFIGNVHPQNFPQGSQAVGRTEPKIIVPFVVTDAGPFMFYTDTDHDGMSDACETASGLDPNNPVDADGDLDGDGLTNGDECALGTLPTNADTDGDGFNDGIEVQLGYDPKDPSSFPPPNGPQLVSLDVTPRSIGLSVGTVIPPQPVQLSVIGTFDTGETLDLTANPATRFESLNDSIAAVDPSGKVIGIAPGSTTIRVRNAGLASDTLIAVTSITESVVGNIKLPGSANNVEVKNQVAYVACGLAGMVVVDARQPATPQVIATVNLDGSANDIRIVGDFAYLACAEGGLSVVNISDPTNPQVVATMPFSDAVDLMVKGEYAYVAAGKNGLKIINIASPYSPYELATFPLSDPATQVANGVDVDEARQLAYLAVRNGGLLVIDVSNPSAPHLRGAVETGPVNLDVAAMGSTALIAGRSLFFSENGLLSVNTQNPDAPQIAGIASLDNTILTDLEVRGNLIFAAANSTLVNFIPIFTLPENQQIPIWSGVIQASNPNQPDDINAYRFSTGIAVDESFTYLTASSINANQNQRTGESRLIISRYNQTDRNDVAPQAAISSPTADLTVIGGETFPITVSASDDIAVVGVEIKVNGQVAANLTEAPFQLSYTVPNAAPGTQLTFEARAIDSAGNVGEAAPVTISIAPDPLTTVIGRVMTPFGTSVANAQVTLQSDNQTTVTDAGGFFEFVGVPTLPFGKAVSASVEEPIEGYQGRSAWVSVVRGGTTDLGLITVSQTKVTLLPSDVTSVVTWNFGGDGPDDLFIGFPDQASQIYFSSGTGSFSFDSRFIMPFGATLSAEFGQFNTSRDLEFDILAQPVGQPQQATTVYLDRDLGVVGNDPFETGLSQECEAMARGIDFVRIGGVQQVYAFLKVTGGTELTARVEGPDRTFGPPIVIPVPGSTPLRGLKVLDVNQDDLVDVLVIAEDRDNQRRLLVFPRTSATTFGTPIESEIITRDLTPSVGTVDFVYSGTDLLVLGDDRV
ncbi:MAG TPA: Ig-like domain-containing protein, partial [Acidobacteriota bacterium]|nr:Ig-like domain-containing protein [Acidobacteriota bacterium]